MKKIVPHILFFLLTITAYSQGVFFNLGKNFSTIQYKNKSAFADKGPTMKRFRPRAQGRAYKILKGTSHITIVMAN